MLDLTPDRIVIGGLFKVTTAATNWSSIASKPQLLSQTPISTSHAEEFLKDVTKFFGRR
jgi:hypothetical protein